MKLFAHPFFHLRERVPKTSLVRYAHGIWRATVLALVLVLVGIIFLDVYIYVGVKGIIEGFPEFASLEDDTLGIKSQLVQDATRYLEERQKLFERAGENLPTRNPFIEKKKK